MTRMKDGVKTKRCGCIVFEHGPPIFCELHAARADKHAAKEKGREEKGLRKLVQEGAARLGHELTRFREYSSCDGKWTAYCLKCGAMCIVYDEIPVAGDQVAGKVLTEGCKRSELLAALHDIGENGAVKHHATEDDSNEDLHLL